MKKIIRKVTLCLRFLLLEWWRLDASVRNFTFRTLFRLPRKTSYERERILAQAGVLAWNQEGHTLSFNDLTLNYGGKAPITDVMSICFYNHPFVHRNFVRNSAFPLEGPYEHHAVTLRPGDNVIDAGANIGVFSLFAAQKVGMSGRVIAFEPIKEACALLSKNVASNSLSNITVAPLALGENAATVSFSKDEGLLGSSGLAEKGGEREDVDQVTLDAYVTENDIKRVDFIKADIEGMERFFLKGAETTIRRDKPRVAICIYHLPDDPEVIEGILHSFVPEYKFERTETKLFAWI